MIDLTSKKQIKRKYASEIPGHVLDADYFYFDTASHTRHDLAIVCGGHEFCAPDFDIKRSNYPYWFIKYTLTGKGMLNTESYHHKLGPGILSGFEPGENHHYTCNSNNPMEHIFITFTGKDCEKLFKSSDLNKKHAIHVANPDIISGIFKQIMRIGQEQEQNAQAICCLYLQILLLEQHSTNRYCQNSRASVNYQQCKQYIDANFSSTNSPTEVAAACNINIRYMSNLFKRFSNITPSKYLIGLKLNKAATMLLTSNLTVKEIAHAVGYQDPYHFSRSFTHFYNYSPRNYRKAYLLNK